MGQWGVYNSGSSAKNHMDGESETGTVSRLASPSLHY